MTFEYIQYKCDLCKTRFRGKKHFEERITNLHRFFGQYTYGSAYDNYGVRSGFEVNHICDDCNARLEEAEGSLAYKIMKETQKERRAAIAKLKREIRKRIKKRESS